MFDRLFCAVLVVVASSTLFCACGNGQTRSSPRLSPLFALDPCISEQDGSGGRHIARLSVVSYLRTAAECDGPEPDRWRIPYEPPPRLAEPPRHAELVDAELTQLGSAGFLLAGARQQVLQILGEHNSCSAWYAQAEENPQRKFASLHYRIDEDGEDTAVSQTTSIGITYREPYVARAQESVGAGSIITLNAKGAFFRLRAPFKVRLHDGAPMFERSRVFLHVANYSGGSLKAQVATLLHEYAHIVGLLPVDFGEANSGSLSTENTFTVLHHCRRQVEASSKRVVVLPATFAGVSSWQRPD
jgi:hypothetical protein